MCKAGFAQGAPGERHLARLGDRRRGALSSLLQVEAEGGAAGEREGMPKENKRLGEERARNRDLGAM